MWWFLKKSQPQALKAVSKHSQAEEGLLAQVPDLSSLEEQQVAIKIWLPELVAHTLKWAADYEGVSQSSWVRARLTAYVYGRVAVLAQRIRAGRAKSEPAIMFSRSAVDRGAGRWVYKVPQLGKNTVAFKVWISQQMRDDLEILARHAGGGSVAFCPGSHGRRFTGTRQPARTSRDHGPAHRGGSSLGARRRGACRSD